MKGKIALTKDNVQSILGEQGGDPKVVHNNNVGDEASSSQLNINTESDTTLQLETHSMDSTINHKNEKERFIAAMELGVTRKASESSKMPHSAINATTATHVDGSSNDENEEKILRQLAFKTELERQMADKKRRKREDQERERLWEKEQEERLAREREKLRKDWEVERAIQRAKVAGEDAGGIQIKVPLGKKDSTPIDENEQIKRKSMRPGILVDVEGKEDASKIKEQKLEEDQQTDQITQPSNTSPENTQVREQLLVQQLEEKLQSITIWEQRCNQVLESFQHLLVGAKTPSIPQPPSTLQQIPIYVQPYILTPQQEYQVQRRTVSAPLPTGLEKKSQLPILYTSTELKTEESRPVSRWPAHHHPSVVLKNHHTYPPQMGVNNMERRAPNFQPSSAAVNDSRSVPRRSTSAKPSLWSSGWKRASRKLRKLTVQKVSGGEEDAWIQEDLSSNSIA